MNSFLISLTSRLSASIYLVGKILRFVFMLTFLIILLTKTQMLANYNMMQVVLFFLMFNLIDTTTQLFFREVYRFRPMVVSGDFDLVLVKPISPLFRALAGGADPLDLIMLVPYVGALVFMVSRLGPVPFDRVILAVLLMGNGFLLSMGFHILVLSLAILTTEIDHTIMIYRDITSMGRVPVDIYREPMRSIITFVIPVGIMMTFPVKALLGLLTFDMVIVSLMVGIVFIVMCIKIWTFALTKYTSASS